MIKGAELKHFTATCLRQHAHLTPISFCTCSLSYIFYSAAALECAPPPPSLLLTTRDWKFQPVFLLSNINHVNQLSIKTECALGGTRTQRGGEDRSPKRALYTFNEFCMGFSPARVFIQSAIFVRFSVDSSRRAILFGDDVLATVPLDKLQAPPAGSIEHSMEGVSLETFRDKRQSEGWRCAKVDFDRTIERLKSSSDGSISQFVIKLDLSSINGARIEDGGRDRLDNGDLWSIHLVVEEANTGKSDVNISKIVSAIAIRKRKSNTA